MLGTVIDISPPNAELLNLIEHTDGTGVAPFLGGTFVKIAFNMQIGELVDSTIMQLYPIEFAKKIVDTFIGVQFGEAMPEEKSSAETNNMAEQVLASADVPMPDTTQQVIDQQMNNLNQQSDLNPQMGMNPQMMGMNPQMMGMNPQMMGMNPQMMGMNPQMMGMNPQMMGMNPQMMGMNPYGYNMGMPQQNVNVQPAQFQSFSGDVNAMISQENIGLIRDVPLEVTVELGRTTKSIADILDFAPGTIIELDRIAGEPIDVLVNGKFVAKGEVVVIEESFGIRVTEIIK
jgi:flagellar motor switch protein FliN/FliY